MESARRRPPRRVASEYRGGQAGRALRSCFGTQRPPYLLFDHRAITLPYLSPSTIKIISSGSERSLGRRLLVDLNTPSRFFIHPYVSVLQFRTAMKDLPGAFIERGILLNAEVIAHDI